MIVRRNTTYGKSMRIARSIMAAISDFRLILASASPRRRELLAVLGWPFEVRVSGIDETPGIAETPLDYVQRVAREKAVASAQAAKPTSLPELVIAADTEVVFEGEVFGKPGNAAQAATMLKRLRGETHEVISAITIRTEATGEVRQDLCRSAVPMRNYSDEEIDVYVASGDPLDKAGAYAIQHDGFHPVESFSHCYASVMGLPLCHLTRSLRSLGIEPPANVPAACQAFIQYDCPVYREILNEVEHV
jgi:MAF protein